ncbi:MAG: tRNA(m5U54)methyltransferase [Candelina submexicana]|nr:MAG: tRNA(m5U54)methyltransferase [Candelina submexicana]
MAAVQSSAQVAPGNATPRNIKKRSQGNGQPSKTKKRKIQHKPVKEGSAEEVLLADIRHLLAAQTLDEASAENTEPQNAPQTLAKLPEPFTEIEVTVNELSSTGDGLALSPNLDHVYVVPFTAPGDIVTTKVIKHFPNEHYTLADFVKVKKPSLQRDDSLIRCPYFASCAGCQLQMLSYKDQLAHKKTIIEKAYRNFSGLAPQFIPSIGPTIGSPLQYGYRTKLTPHFDGPPGSRSRKDRRDGVHKKAFEEVPPIGFMKKGTRKTIDIEDCPIGTDAVRLGMKSERKRVADEIGKYKRGATLLLRESTKRISNEEGADASSAPSSTKEVPSPMIIDNQETLITTHSTYTTHKTCITDSNATSTEYIDSYIFTNPAGAFFQNNNSILPVFTEYIRSHILLPPPSNPTSSITAQKPLKYLIDAYSGSGLFSVTLSPLFTSSTGIDISASSILSATHNARLNSLSDKCTFLAAADASALFSQITYPADETVVIIDPPRKGCDRGFLKQLVGYAPRRVVYVSCNVHTQARDVGWLVGGEGDGKGLYEMESLRGFDFFPQTGHVEGVAILRRREGEVGVGVEKESSDV